MERRDRPGIDIDRASRRPDPDVDDERIAARRRHPVGEIGELLAFRVRRADDVDALHRLPDKGGRSRALDEIDAVEPGGEDREADDDEEQDDNDDASGRPGSCSGRPFSQSGTRLKASAPSTTSPQPIGIERRLKGWKISTSERMQIPMIVCSMVAAVLADMPRRARGSRS